MTTDTLSYSLILTRSPLESGLNAAAAEFTAAVLRKGHRIDRVFMYKDAAYTALSEQTPPQGQEPAFAPWLKLLESHSFPLQVCIANAIRRGVLNEDEANRYEKKPTIHPAFELCGLGEVASAFAESDRVITF